MSVIYHAGRVIRAVRRAYFAPSFSPDSLAVDMRAVFAHYGIDHAQAMAHLQEVLSQHGMRQYDETWGMCSQHWVFFAGLSCHLPAGARILEIGTYNARFTQVLAALYPEGVIVTCDLPGTSPTFTSTYRRHGSAEREQFVVERDELLSSLPNVEMLHLNSFLLPQVVRAPFDAVWVDGSHDYPDVAWDASNAYQLVVPGGLVLFDDIYLHRRARRPFVPDANDSHDLLRRLVSEGLIEVRYAPKRLIGRHSADPMHRRHFAITIQRALLPNQEGPPRA